MKKIEVTETRRIGTCSSCTYYEHNASSGNGACRRLSIACDPDFFCADWEQESIWRTLRDGEAEERDNEVNRCG